MTFPTIPTGGRVLSSNQLDSTGTRTFPNFSGLTQNQGDLLIAIVYGYQTTAAAGSIFSSWSNSFTELADLGGSTNGCLGVAYKWRGGSAETGTLTVTQAATITGDASMVLLSIPGAHATTPPEITALASGTSAAADPASLNPAGWGTEDTLWIAVTGNGMTNITGTWTGIDGAPTNYSNLIDTNASDTSTIGDCSLGVAFRQLNAASEDAGGFTQDLSNARNHAVLIAVRPAPAATPLTVQDATHAQATDSIALTQHNILVAQDATHAQHPDAIALTQHNVLAVQDATQAQSVDAITLTAHAPSTPLTVQDATHAQHPDPITLTQHNVLVVQDATHGQPVDAVALTQHNVLTVNDARQLQATDSIALTQHNVLAVQDATHAHHPDAITLTPHNPGATTLTVNDTAHAMAVDSIALTQHHALTVQDAAHAQHPDPIALTQHHVLTVQDGLLAHTADTVALTVHAAITGMVGRVSARPSLPGNMVSSAKLLSGNTEATGPQPGAVTRREISLLGGVA